MGCSSSRSAQADAETPQERQWTALGGKDLEEPLRKEWAKLIRASWLIELAEGGGTLRRRQDLPPEAFVGLGELKAAGPFNDNDGWNWLRVIVVSYPWLQPGHPDPHGENLRVVAKALKFYEKDDRNQGKPHGVFIDFCALLPGNTAGIVLCPGALSLQQAERTAEEYESFKRALGALHLFYSHPKTVVFKLTKFPPGYPNNSAFQYVLPAGANTVEYAKRGWCSTESAVSGLVKSADQVLDLGQLGEERHLLDLISGCKFGRAPPLHPDDFTAALQDKTFTNKKDDFAKVADLYSAAFHRLFETAQELDYEGLLWGSNEVLQMCKALRCNATLRKLVLANNVIGTEGAKAVAEALRRSTTLKLLDLGINRVGAEGAKVLAEALHVNTSLIVLDLRGNNIGDEGATALREALRVNTSLQTIHLYSNNIGEEVRDALWQANPKVEFNF